MKVLVTGGAGFIGSHVAEHYQGRAEVVVLDNFRSGRRSNLDGLDVRLVEGDIRDEDTVREAMRGVSHVYHLAALISVPESMERPRECVAINVEGTLNVLEAAAEAGAAKMVFASSSAVYGDNPEVPKKESMPPAPASPYAITKLDGEYYCALAARQHGLATACLRFFNVFGPRQDPCSAYAAAVPAFIHRALRGEPLIVFGDGLQTRDFVFVKDIVSGLTFAGETPDTEGVFNCGGGGQTTIVSLAEKIIRLAHSESRVAHAPERSGDVRHSLASVDKLRAAGWTPRHDLEEGLAITLEFFRAQRQSPA